MESQIVQNIEDVIGGYSGNSRTVLDYCLVMKRLVDGAKRPGATIDDWAALADFVAVDDFVRVGAFKEVIRWPEYVGFLHQWARHSEWECSFKRIGETANGLVFLELEERGVTDGRRTAINSVSVYEFDAAGKLVHLDIYLQTELEESRTGTPLG